MAKVRRINSKKQDDQPVVATPFKHIELFPGFVPTQETIDYVNARSGEWPPKRWQKKKQVQDEE